MDPRTGLPVLAVVGGGQLARMTHQAAIALGQSLRVLATAPTESAAAVAADVRIGHHTDLAALRDLADGATAVTFDHEHVPLEHLRTLVAEGVTVLPGPDALAYAQDKRAMRERLAGLAVPGPAWAPVTRPADVRALGEGPVVVKAARGGYDGRGVWLPADLDAAEAIAVRELDRGTPLLVEARVPLLRELSALVARSPYGQVAAWPIVETVQRDGICVEVLAPAPGLSAERATDAQRLAIEIATALDVVGVLAVELFDTAGGLLVNELAMRPHNSGHWTIDGSRTSQFEQHVRAVLDYPLGAVTPTAPVTAMANVLGGPPGGIGPDERLHHVLAADPGVKVHLYGKEDRPGRKIGHVTVPGEDLADCRARAVRAARRLATGTGTP